jgi:hypothetical protein
MSTKKMTDLNAVYKKAVTDGNLESFSSSQQELIAKLVQEKDFLLEKIAKLEKSSSVVTLGISAEEHICIEQLNILKQRSDTRELNLEEVKRLDLLIKNLRLIREQSTNIVNTVAENESDSYLLAIVGENNGE